MFLPADPTLTGCAERVEVELRQQVLDEVGAAFDVEPPPGLARRADFQPLDAQVEPGGMIVAGVHYARGEVDAARRLLRELGQSERALRSVLEFVRRERVGGPPAAARRPFPRTAASSTSAARSTASPAAGRSCDARSTPATRGRRRRRGSTARWASAAAPTPARRSSTTASRSCAQSSPSSPATTPSRPSGCGFPRSVEAIAERVGVATGEG